MGNFDAPALLRRVPREPADLALGLSELKSIQTGNTENEITDGLACKTLTVIFTRRITETVNVRTITDHHFSKLYTSTLCPQKPHYEVLITLLVAPAS